MKVLGVACTTLACMIVSTGVLAGAIDYHVDAHNGDDSSSGTSADQAWRTITYAISAASPSATHPVTIHIAAGTYSVSANGERLPLSMKSYLTLGGAGAQSTILDAEDTAYHVLHCAGLEEVTISGLTIMRGCADGNDTYGYGGGIYCLSSSVTISDCCLRDNSAIAGGAISAIDSNIALSHSELRGNRSIASGADGGQSLGAGLYSEMSSIKLDYCEVLDNDAEFDLDNGASWGGGLYLRTGSVAEISHCTLTANSAGYGGGIYFNQSEATIQDCLISENIAQRSLASGLYDSMAGGLCCEGADVTIEGSTIEHNQSLVGTKMDSMSYGGGISLIRGSEMDLLASNLIGNSASTGGAIDSDTSFLTMQGCMIQGNIGTPGTGAYSSSWAAGLSFYNASAEISNCAIYGNESIRSPAIHGDEQVNLSISNCTVAGNRFTKGAAIVLTNSIMWGNSGSFDLYTGAVVAVAHSCLEDGHAGVGNISHDPLLATGPWGDYYLSSEAAGQDESSPCIDAGSDTAAALGLNELTTRTDCVPDTGVVDMGYHYPAETLGPTIACFLNSSEFRMGDSMLGSVEARNDGMPVEVDVYVGLVLADGAIICLTDTGFAFGIHAWFSGIMLPSGFEFGPAEVFRTVIPGGVTEGECLFATALSEPETLDFIDICYFPFAITE